MFNNLNERLKEVQVKLRERDKLSNQLTLTIKELDIENVRMDTLRNILEKEQMDVDKLEGVSLTGIFYSILGSKEEQLEKERQELLSAKLKYDEAKASINRLQAESVRLIGEMEEVEDLEVEFFQLLSEKEKFIKDNKFSQAEELFKLTELESLILSHEKELKEAIIAGEKAITSLGNAIEDLRSSENWGTWDMLGGGFISTAIKHSRMDTAQEKVYQAQNQLKIFQRELSDIQSLTNIDFNLDSFTRFSDYFFDNLITDWVVQRKIKDSLETTENKLNEVQSIVKELKSESSKNNENLNKVKEEYLRILTEMC